MKMPSFLAVACLSAVSFAQAASSPAPAPFEGSFAYRGRADLSSILEREAVEPLTQEGQDRLAALKEEGFICRSAAGTRTQLCTRITRSSQLPVEVKRKLDRRYQGRLEIHFSAPTAEPTLLTDGELVKEWQIAQKIEMLGKTYEQNRLSRFRDSEKLLLGSDPITDETSVIVGAGRASYALQITLSGPSPEALAPKHRETFYTVLVQME